MGDRAEIAMIPYRAPYTLTVDTGEARSAIGESIAARRKALRCNEADLACFSGVSVQTVRRVEGGYRVRVETLERLEAGLARLATFPHGDRFQLSGGPESGDFG